MTTAAAPPPDGALLLTEAQVGMLIGFSRRTVRAWVSAGKFPPPVKLPGAEAGAAADDDKDRFAGERRPKRWRRADVDAWIAQLGSPKT